MKQKQTKINRNLKYIYNSKQKWNEKKEKKNALDEEKKN